jgi:hypothetical protein
MLTTFVLSDEVHPPSSLMSPTIAHIPISIIKPLRKAADGISRQTIEGVPTVP